MRAFTPELLEMPARTVLVAETTGEPDKVAQAAIERLYGTAYGTKFKVFKPKGKEMKIGGLSAQWLNPVDTPKSSWKAIWGLVVPDFVAQADLIQKNPAEPVKLSTWAGGTTAQILHKGLYSEEEPTIRTLHQYITDQGYEIVGPHEEEYLTRPDVKEPKTIIRYLVRKRA